MADGAFYPRFVDVPAGRAGVRYAVLKEFPMYAFGDDGSAWSRWSGEWAEIRPFPQTDDHLGVNLAAAWAPNVKRRWYVHDAVLTAFVGPRPFAAAEGCHKNSDKCDNRLANLYWGSKSDNNNDRRVQKSWEGG